jgi:fatty-acyl-CoA synthase
MTPSYQHGASSEPLIGHTIDSQLEHTAARFPDSLALIVPHQGIRLTYREFKQRIDVYAAALIGLGLSPGARIGLLAPNCWEWTVCQFAAARVGLVLVTINPAYQLAELEFALNKVGCSALVVAPSYKSTDFIGMLQQLCPKLTSSQPGDLRSPRIPSLRAIICLGRPTAEGMFGFDELTAFATRDNLAKAAEVSAGLQFDDAINIQFTSGTTGAPKGATLTHHNILNNGRFNARALNLSSFDRVCIPVPLYHCFGMVMGNLACICVGAAMVYPSAAFDSTRVLETISTERCTALYGVPTMFISVLEHPRFAQFDLSSLRTGTMAGAPCPVEVMKRVMGDMHMSEVTIAYGMTETSPVSLQTLADDPLVKRIATVGQVHPHVEVKIVDNAGRIVPHGVPGELLTRGYSVMRGYWEDVERTREAIDSSGWMHTGDVACMDAEGYVSIVGRLKDIIIRGGENISPREVEEFLHRHPKVQDVQVFGIPDARLGEVVCAWLKLRSGEEATDTEIREFCHGKIARHKIPLHVRLVDEFPMTVTGKVQKFVMREKMKLELQGKGSL